MYRGTAMLPKPVSRPLPAAVKYKTVILSVQERHWRL